MGEAEGRGDFECEDRLVDMVGDVSCVRGFGVSWRWLCIACSCCTVNFGAGVGFCCRGLSAGDSDRGLRGEGV